MQQALVTSFRSNLGVYEEQVTIDSTKSGLVLRSLNPTASKAGNQVSGHKDSAAQDLSASHNTRIPSISIRMVPCVFFMPEVLLLTV